MMWFVATRIFECKPDNLAVFPFVMLIPGIGELECWVHESIMAASIAEYNDAYAVKARSQAAKFWSSCDHNRIVSLNIDVVE